MSKHGNLWNNLQQNLNFVWKLSLAYQSVVLPGERWCQNHLRICFHYLTMPKQRHRHEIISIFEQKHLHLSLYIWIYIKIYNTIEHLVQFPSLLQSCIPVTTMAFTSFLLIALSYFSFKPARIVNKTNWMVTTDIKLNGNTYANALLTPRYQHTNAYVIKPSLSMNIKLWRSQLLTGQ